MQQVRTRHWHWHCSTSSCCGRVVLISVLGTSSCCGPRQEEERETEPTWPPPEAEQTCETAEMLLWPLRLSHRGDRLTPGSLAIRLSRGTAGGETTGQPKLLRHPCCSVCSHHTTTTYREIQAKTTAPPFLNPGHQKLGERTKRV